MKYIKATILITISITTLFACKKDNDNSIAPDPMAVKKAQLTGSWGTIAFADDTNSNGKMDDYEIYKMDSLLYYEFNFTEDSFRLKAYMNGYIDEIRNKYSLSTDGKAIIIPGMFVFMIDTLTNTDMILNTQYMSSNNEKSWMILKKQ